MNQSETLIAESSFSSFTGLTKTVTEIIERKKQRFEKWDISPVKTINNYLKTPEEMDAEFCLEMNRNNKVNKEYAGIYGTYGTFVHEDGNTNTYGSDGTPSGFMEENY